mmetsp:Transcript_38793/g.37134  ORF Transcript_38793/g.37134 Transcript_38793/m.37134 type:complete len:234 (+) Transcript_38793:1194-1895(+)
MLPVLLFPLGLLPVRLLLNERLVQRSRHLESLDHHLPRHVLDGVLLMKEVSHPLHHPRVYVFVDDLLDGLDHHALVSEGLEGVLLEALEVLLGHDPGHMLLVGSFPFFLASLLLDPAPFQLLLSSELGGFQALGLDELCVPDLLILLGLHPPHLLLFLLQHYHPRLLQRLLNQHVQHRLYFVVKVEELIVLFERLDVLAVLFGRHLRLEQRHRRPIQVELCRHPLLPLRRLVS